MNTDLGSIVSPARSNIVLFTKTELKETRTVLWIDK